MIIGLGGGSPIDAAKGIQVLATAPGNIDKYFLDNDPPKVTPDVKLIAIQPQQAQEAKLGREA